METNTFQSLPGLTSVTIGDCTCIYIITWYLNPANVTCLSGKEFQAITIAKLTDKANCNWKVRIRILMPIVVTQEVVYIIIE